MATCANCSHHSLCDYNTNISGNGKVRLVYAEGADVKCSFFENTANVVPKSEVEMLRDDNRFLQDRRFKELSEVRSEAKTEVAIEIFEEIDILGTYNPTLYAELKKKYTEVEK